MTGCGPEMFSLPSRAAFPVAHLRVCFIVLLVCECVAGFRGEVGDECCGSGSMFLL